MIDLDFSGTKKLEDVIWKPIEDGEYLFIITDAEQKASKTEGTLPSLKVVLTMVEDEKKTVWKFFYLDPDSEIGMAVLKDFLEKLYQTELSGSINLNPKELVGKQIIAQITTEPRNDDPKKMQNTVVYFASSPV